MGVSAGRPLTRAAILLATAAAATGCGKEPKGPETQDSGMMIAAPYGVPIPQDAEPPDAGTMVVQPYGVPLPPPDAATMAAPAYGVPPASLDPTKKKDAGAKK
jgi:hypothetical protein